jgi:hypothetical protein
MGIVIGHTARDNGQISSSKSGKLFPIASEQYWLLGKDGTLVVVCGFFQSVHPAAGWPTTMQL